MSNIPTQPQIEEVYDILVSEDELNLNSNRGDIRRKLAEAFDGDENNDIINAINSFINGLSFNTAGKFTTGGGKRKSKKYKKSNKKSRKLRNRQFPHKKSRRKRR
jgi:hypothetical protein